MDDMKRCENCYELCDVALLEEVDGELWCPDCMDLGEEDIYLDD